MIIAQSSLNFTSAYRASSTLSVKEDFHAWIDAPQPPAQQDRVTITGQQPTASSDPDSKNMSTTDPRLLMFVRLLEALTGRKIELADMSGIGETPAGAADIAAIADPNQASRPEQPPREGWGMTYTRNETLTEHEQVTVNASGTVTTSDGRSFDISLNVKLSRDFMSQNNISIREGDAKRIDPLVINLDGAPVSLSNVRFSFDLNADGTTEDIPFVSSGSGILALDRNNDGKILDGAELFGPTTGNALAELSRLDKDGNGWIDESDSAFGRLSIWTKDAEGNDRYQSLNDAGVGALALAGVEADYSFKNSQNELLGVLRQAGLYLHENGAAGSLQQIDLAV